MNATTGYDGTSHSGGTAISFTSGARTNIAINGINLVSSGKFSHTVYTTGSGLGITDSSATKSVTGTLVVLHNLEKVTGTSTFNAVTFTSTCCTPTGGSISTLFSAGAANGNANSKFIGKTETLAFTGCGTANFTDITGTTSAVTLSHCF
ncbi:MAG: hypothetical protein ACXWPM_01045 [Bdellovibrionota bacterium]